MSIKEAIESKIQEVTDEVKTQFEEIEEKLTNWSFRLKKAKDDQDWDEVENVEGEIDKLFTDI